MTLSDSFQTVWSGVGYGVGVEKQISWELSIPRPGTYRTTFYVNVAH